MAYALASRMRAIVPVFDRSHLASPLRSNVLRLPGGRSSWFQHERIERLRSMRGEPPTPRADTEMPNGYDFDDRELLCAMRRHLRGFRALDRNRVEACVFMAATARGPVSMCLHNARRDSFILQPLEVETSGARRRWDPLSGFADAPANPRPVVLKGRTKRSTAISAKAALPSHPGRS